MTKVKVRECNNKSVWIYFESRYYHEDWDSETGEQYDSNIEEYTIPKSKLNDELSHIFDYEGVDVLQLDLDMFGMKNIIVYKNNINIGV